MPNTLLIVEPEPARQRQGELSRFQEALGLRKKPTANGKRLELTALVLQN